LKSKVDVEPRVSAGGTSHGCQLTRRGGLGGPFKKDLNKTERTSRAKMGKGGFGESKTRKKPEPVCPHAGRGEKKSQGSGAGNPTAFCVGG